MAKVRVVVPETSSGAPQCPQCDAHDMVLQDDGTYACPGRCPGAAYALPIGRGAGICSTFTTTLGAHFALCGGIL
ncbi:MAG: hypothetical protein ABIG71_02860 [Candidatus Uhrbacteria bacterium]